VYVDAPAASIDIDCDCRVLPLGEQGQAIILSASRMRFDQIKAIRKPSPEFRDKSPGNDFFKLPISWDQELTRHAGPESVSPLLF
jgi:hypothetical protein